MLTTHRAKACKLNTNHVVGEWPSAANIRKQATPVHIIWYQPLSKSACFFADKKTWCVPGYAGACVSMRCNARPKHPTQFANIGLPRGQMYRDSTHTWHLKSATRLTIPWINYTNKKYCSTKNVIPTLVGHGAQSFTKKTVKKLYLCRSTRLLALCAWSTWKMEGFLLWPPRTDGPYLTGVTPSRKKLLKTYTHTLCDATRMVPIKTKAPLYT